MATTSTTTTPNNLIEMGEHNFDPTIKKGVTFVDLWASWCGPCRMFAPIFSAAATRHPDITFAKVDTEKEPGLSGYLGVQAIPTLLIFKGRGPDLPAGWCLARLGARRPRQTGEGARRELGAREEEGRLTRQSRSRSGRPQCATTRHDVPPYPALVVGVPPGMS